MAIKQGSLSPAFIKSILQDARPVEASAADILDQDAGIVFGKSESENSVFKYDPIDFPLKSTQQLKTDWSKFENHTFFSSAETKVNEAFDILINRYPFDGRKSEIDEFISKLTGFEKWIFDQFPSWSGALHFSGTQVGEDGVNGTYVSVVDKSGELYPELSRNSSGETIINQSITGSLSIESLLFLPPKVNDTQIIYQKTSSEEDGITFFLKPSTSTSHVTASFCISSGSFRTSAEGILNKGSYNHICLVMNREILAPSVILQIYNNEKLISDSNKFIEVGKFSTDNADFIIGSGSSFYCETTLVTPTQTLSGTLDELRIFHSVRDIEKQKLYGSKGIYATPDLKLYYRFNEPPPLLSEFSASETVNSIVLDSSGNSLHSQISNFTGSLRVNASKDELNPIKNEKKQFNIVLFPAYSEVKSFNSTLLASASLYDDANPNFIAKLVPKHYFLEGAAEEGFLNKYGNSGNSYSGAGIPGQGRIGSTHLILSFLYVWSKFFDDIKMFIDAFGYLKTVDYDSVNTVPDNFLNNLIKSYGFYLPSFFNHANITKYVDDSDGPSTEYTSGTAFRDVHAQILRRLLVNINDIVASKGTQHSIKSFLRSIGIDPENSLKIREYGGPTVKMLGTSRNKKIDSIAVIDFVSSSLVISTPLSASRVEPGFPEPSGSFVYNSSGKVIGTTVASDGLLTSGSWTLECLYKFPPYKMSYIGVKDQSLMRLIVTGSDSYARPGLVTNVIAKQKSLTEPSKVKAYIRPGTSNQSPTLVLSLDLSGSGIFDGERWNVSVGRKRSDEYNSGYLSSSYFLRVGKSNTGDIDEIYQTSEFFYEKNSTEKNSFEFLSSSFNSSGSYICLGDNQTFPQSILHPYLNNTIENPPESRTTSFYGWASNLRFWSKFTTLDEWKEHVRNHKSTGVYNPKVNYNFVNYETGSFNRLRVDTFLKQPDRNANINGDLIFVNHSGNNIILTGSQFGSGSNVIIVGDVAQYSYLSPEFDEAATDDKVRIRGLTEFTNLQENPYAYAAPVYASNEGFIREEPVDDTRLSIEFSLTDALDRDIVNMFSSFDALSDAIGSPELMFSPDYPGLNELSDVYFNKLTENLNFRRFLEFYRWFDVSISTFVDQLVPGKTRYKGTNFVIESHMLERHKRESRHSENYIGSKLGVEPSSYKLLIPDLSVIINK